jgi:hypothetical protein
MKLLFDENLSPKLPNRMTFNPVSSDPFEHYFYKRAQLADEMASVGHVTDSHTLAIASLDALAAIWLHDFPDIRKNLEIELGGKVPASIRLTRFLKHFIVDDPRVSMVAVVCFAEDWKYYRPQDSHLAEKLLITRISNNPNQPPKSYLNVSRIELAQECPELNSRPDLAALAEEYEYGSLMYSLYRCPLVHFATNSRRTHGFASGEEVMYYWSFDVDDRFTIGFGPNLATLWLRKVASNYIHTCNQEGIIPAHNINAGTIQEDRLKKRWSRP